MSEWKSFNPEVAKKSLPTLDDGAMHGVLGSVTKVLTDRTEACAAAVFACLLVIAGSLMNGKRFLKIAKDTHYGILFIKVIGKSAKGRKGFAKNLAVEFFKLVDPTLKKRMRTGLTSGEGLVSIVSDFYEKKQKKGPGIDMIERTPEEKIVVIIEGEGARLLRVMERTGNTLSPVLRDLWDASDVAVENKNSPIRSTRPLVSLCSNITIDELKKTMQQVEIANGYANRFLPVFSTRARVEPFGGTIDDEELKRLAELIKINHARSLEIAKTSPEFTFTKKGKEFWTTLYQHYASNEQPGMLGSLTARAEPMMLRIALILAFYDGVEQIDDVHLIAADHVWQYAEQTWKHIYGDSLGDPLADAILKFLRSTVKEKSKTEIHNHFDNNKSSAELNKALLMLFEAGLIQIQEGVDTDSGKRKFLYRATKTEDSTNSTNPTNGATHSSNSSNSSDTAAAMRAEAPGSRANDGAVQ